MAVLDTESGLCDLDGSVAVNLKKNTMKTEWIARLKAIANENYGKGYGWQVLVECYDTTDWLNLVGCCDTWADALNLMIRTAEIQTDRHDDACAEIL